MASKKELTTRRRPGSITVMVADSGGIGGPIDKASVSLYRADAATCDEFDLDAWRKGQLDARRQPLRSGRTDAGGEVSFDAVEPGVYVVTYNHFPVTDPACVEVEDGCPAAVCLHPRLEVDLITYVETPDCKRSDCSTPQVGDRLVAKVGFVDDTRDELTRHIEFDLPPGAIRSTERDGKYRFTLPLRTPGAHMVEMALRLGKLPDTPGGGGAARYAFSEELITEPREPSPITGNINVALSRTETDATPDLLLWTAIRSSTDKLSFDRYQRFMAALFCADDDLSLSKAEGKPYRRLLQKRFLPFTDTDAYRVMKAATEAFVISNCGVLVEPEDFHTRSGVLSDALDYLALRDLPAPARGTSYAERVDGFETLPYLAIIRRKLPDVAIDEPEHASDKDIQLCDGFVREKLAHPCLIELIWSYWHEEAMQVQTMNAIMRRFQNVRGPHLPDPLGAVETHPLRPLNNLLWGYVQDEQHRLTVQRRNYEYDHHYGLRLEGRAVQDFRPVDTRSKFIEAFHHLLRLCTEFYRQDDDTTVKADAFGVLNALKEVHLILSEGAHNQFGDLPSTARVEMLMQQWLLARPEFREFLPTRAMVAYPEPWMDRVDAMKKLQGWTDTSVIHFHNLAVFGEQILLSIRYGAWSVVFEPIQALNFARFWRPQIQGYIHAYRAATGVELGAPTVAAGVDATLPSVLLQKRLAAQQRSALK